MKKMIKKLIEKMFEGNDMNMGLFLPTGMIPTNIA